MYSSTIFKLINNEQLSTLEVEGVFEEVLAGRLSESQIASLLTALKMKGIEPDELLGLAQTVLKHARPFQAHNLQGTIANEALLDVCGTGGDHSNTFNVSTATAIVCAAAGVPVVKHGNRAATSKCGSFDLLEAAGVWSLDSCHPEPVEGDTNHSTSYFDKLSMTKGVKDANCVGIERDRLKKNNIAFLFAPFFHPSLKIVAPVRKSLGFPTVFNILGPLVNPARPQRQMIGIARPEYADLMGPVAMALGVEKVVFVHGDRGLDEVSVCGLTRIVEYTKDKSPKKYEIMPSDLGMKTYSAENLIGGEVQENTRIIEAVFNNMATDAQRDFVLANCGVALYTAGKVETIREGVELAEETSQCGKTGSLWKKLKNNEHYAKS